MGTGSFNVAKRVGDFCQLQLGGQWVFIGVFGLFGVCTFGRTRVWVNRQLVHVEVEHAFAAVSSVGGGFHDDGNLRHNRFGSDWRWGSFGRWLGGRNLQFNVVVNREVHACIHFRLNGGRGGRGRQRLFVFFGLLRDAKVNIQRAAVARVLRLHRWRQRHCVGAKAGTLRSSRGRWGCRCTARFVERVGGVKLSAEGGDGFPVNAMPLRDGVGFVGYVFECAGVAPLAVNLGEFAVDGSAARLCDESLGEDFFGLHVATISQVDISLCHGVDVASSVKLAGRINHG